MRSQIDARWFVFAALLLFPATSSAQRPGMFLFRNLDLLLISMESVQDELQLKPNQGELLEALGEDLRSQRTFRRRRRERSRPTPKTTEVSVPDKLVHVVLEEDQIKRLTELRFQFQGPYAIDDDGLLNDLQLSSEQLDAIREVREDESALSLSKLMELIGDEKAKIWRKSMGKRFRFDEELSSFRATFYRFKRGSTR